MVHFFETPYFLVFRIPADGHIPETHNVEWNSRDHFIFMQHHLLCSNAKQALGLLDTKYGTLCPLSLTSDCLHCPQAVIVPNLTSEVHNIYLSMVMECKIRPWVVRCGSCSIIYLVIC
jgi:hypothetical protein